MCIRRSTEAEARGQPEVPHRWTLKGCRKVDLDLRITCTFDFFIFFLISY
ncbi:unnamed protein product [Enterobius vermicularis]|uniref:Uncharacterized protein n=1 Tax=Enterobius vermicularis TaxID=51028 RepID=A0A0N4VAK4_ENTVE|nr:unnamed protein product [Enterobius vermicularis]